MSDPATVYKEALAHLARGEEILVLHDLERVAEATRQRVEKATEDLAQAGTPTPAVLATFLEDGGGEELLALGLPLITYGGERARRGLSAALSHVGRSAVLRGSGHVVHNAAGTLVVGRLLWSLCAQALSEDVLGALSIPRTAALPADWDREAPPMSEDRRLRFAAACDGNSLETFKHYKAWLEQSDWLGEAAPYLAFDADTHLKEVDLLFGLAAAVNQGGVSVTRGVLEEATCSRLAAHVHGASAEVATFLGVPRDQLMQTLDERLGAVSPANNPWREESPLRRLLGLKDQSR